MTKRRKLTDEQYDEIGRDTRHQSEIAKQYGVTKSHIYHIQKKYGLVYPYRPGDELINQRNRKN